MGNQALGTLLLEFDADIDAQNDEGATALILAIKAPGRGRAGQLSRREQLSSAEAEVHQLDFADFMVESDADCAPDDLSEEPWKVMNSDEEH